MKPFLSTLDIVDDSLSDKAFSCVTTWLTDCISHHAECRTLDTTFKPHRLINIGSFDGSQEPFLFEPTEASPYIALSYCWGTDLDGIPITTKNVLESYHCAIQYSSLPRTLQDAVTFCRRIKVQHLWVDQLCIVQDDEEDWLREAAQMHHVYSNSHLTVAAHKPASCKLGFLGPQEYGRDTWQRAFYTRFNKSPSSGHLNKMYIRIGFTLKESSEWNSSLEDRGWTLQESILPTRILHFTGDEMAWECSNWSGCECGHVQGSDVEGTAAPFLKTSFMKGLYSFENNDPFRDAWMRVVVQYSSRTLTRDTDKLIAISGLVQMLRDSMNPQNGLVATYLAGIWLESLPRQLLWQVPDPRLSTHRATRPLKYRAPTWSWASIDGHIEFEIPDSNKPEDSDIVISDYHCSPESALNPVGSVTGGYLVVTGPLVPVQLVTIEYSSDDREVFVRSENLISYTVLLDFPGNLPLRAGDLGYECWREGQCRPERCSDCYFEKNQAFFYCLRVAFNYNKRICSLYFLVLKKVSSVEGVYERVGFGRWREYKSNGVLPQNCNDFNIRLFETAKMSTIKII